jgi:ribosomal protein L31
MKQLLTLVSVFILVLPGVQAQNQNYWQQKVDYTMNIDVDAKNHQYSGEQTLVYTNNSADVLNRVYYHLYFNAFQPGSMMDIRSRTIEDPDRRVGDRIYHLDESEIGYEKN